MNPKAPGSKTEKDFDLGYAKGVGRWGGGRMMLEIKNGRKLSRKQSVQHDILTYSWR